MMSPREGLQQKLDEALSESFPASDPIAVHGDRSGYRRDVRFHDLVRSPPSLPKVQQIKDRNSWTERLTPTGDAQ